MRIGITFDLKGDAPADDPLAPDDLQEEFDSPETIDALIVANTSTRWSAAAP